MSPLDCKTPQQQQKKINFANIAVPPLAPWKNPLAAFDQMASRHWHTKHEHKKFHTPRPPHSPLLNSPLLRTAPYHLRRPCRSHHIMTPQVSHMLPSTPQPPVKKRGRFIPTSHRDTPHAFCRDELDADDSDDHPDLHISPHRHTHHFRHEPRANDHRDPMSPTPRNDRVCGGARARVDAHAHRRAGGVAGEGKSPTADPAFLHMLPHDVERRYGHRNDHPQFEVDDLDSTDDEFMHDDTPVSSDSAQPHIQLGDAGLELGSEDEEDDPDFQLRHDEVERACEDPPIEPYEAGLVSRVSQPEQVDVEEDDDENDPDFMVLPDDVERAFGDIDFEEVDLDELDADDGDPDAWNDGDECSNPDTDEDYARFLVGLVNNGDAPAAEMRQSGTAPSGGTATDRNITPDNVLNHFIEDDDDYDFDYLRASAMVRDDPLEYRHDLQVSRKEIAQLLFSNEESNLRRQTRSRRAVPQRRGRPSTAAESCAPGRPPVAPPLAMRQPPPVPLPAALPQPVPFVSGYVGIPRPSVGSVSPTAMFQFKEQLGTYAQLLTDVHASVSKSARDMKERERDRGTSSGAAESDGKVALTEACERSEKLLRRLVENKKLSTTYHDMLKTHVGQLKRFSEKSLLRDVSNYDTNNVRVSVYNLPSIDLIDSFLSDCATQPINMLPTGVLKRFEPHNRTHITQALRARPRRPQYSAKPVRDGWFTWTQADDTLLAMTMAKYGREFGAYSSDLLPHRQEDDCQARVRYLSSRRCADNPVKRQVMHISTPLNRDEVALVQVGLQRYGERVEDEEVWKCIQRDLLPGREWSHLQKLWLWRETRRKYKAKYRAKLNEKKRAALQQSTAQT